MSDERLPGFNMASVHREKISKDKQGFIKRVLGRFARDPRRLQFLIQKF